MFGSYSEFHTGSGCFQIQDLVSNTGVTCESSSAVSTVRCAEAVLSHSGAHNVVAHVTNECKFFPCKCEHELGEEVSQTLFRPGLVLIIVGVVHE